MSKYLNIGFLVSVSLLMVGLYLTIITCFAPTLFNSGMITWNARNIIYATFPLVSLVAGFGAMLALILSGIADVVFSRNSNKWKFQWVANILVLQLIGLVAYYLVGRKERVEEPPRPSKKGR